MKALTLALTALTLLFNVTQVYADIIETISFGGPSQDSTIVFGTLTLDLTTNTIIADTLYDGLNTNNDYLQQVFNVGDDIRYDIVYDSPNVDQLQIRGAGISSGDISLDYVTANQGIWPTGQLTLNLYGTYLGFGYATSQQTVSISIEQPSVPESASVALLATGLIGFAASRRVVGQVSA